jgi:hypothetical protein
VHDSPAARLPWNLEVRYQGRDEEDEEDEAGAAQTARKKKKTRRGTKSA